MSISAALNVARRYGDKYANGGAVNVNPSPAQKDAGNYKMRHIVFQGIPISIENPKGTIRSGLDHNGKPWSTRMTEDYGYIKRTEGHDGDQVDVFVGPNKRSQRVWIIDQLHHHMRKFDEHKCMLGFNTEKQAMHAYHKSYGRVYGASHTVGGLTELSIDAFKEWLKGGGGKEPMAPDVPKFQTGGAVEDQPPIEDVPGVGPVPTTIPEPVKKFAQQQAEFVATPGRLMEPIPGEQLPTSGELTEEDVQRQRWAQEQRAQQETGFGAQAAMALYGTSAPFVKPGMIGVAGGRPPPTESPQVIASQMAEHILTTNENQPWAIAHDIHQLAVQNGPEVADKVFNALPGHIQAEVDPELYQWSKHYGHNPWTGWRAGEPPTSSPLSLEQAVQLSPEEIGRLPKNTLRDLDNEIIARRGKIDDLVNQNPQGWAALNERLDKIAGKEFQLRPEDVGIDPESGQFYHEISQEGRQNFEQKFIDHILPHVGEPQNFFKDYFGGLYRADRISSEWFNSTGFQFDGILTDEYGNYAGNIRRRFDPETKTAYHELLEVPRDLRGEGTVPNMLRNQIDLYRKMGIENVKMNANKDVGSYAWAKYGWIPDSPQSWKTLASSVRGMITRSEVIPPTAELRDKILQILADPNPEAVWKLADIDAIDRRSGKEIGKALLTNRSWLANLRLTDPTTLNRFYGYVAKKRTHAE